VASGVALVADVVGGNHFFKGKKQTLIIIYFNIKFTWLIGFVKLPSNLVVG
jgi:hypothetical protein